MNIYALYITSPKTRGLIIREFLRRAYEGWRHRLLLLGDFRSGPPDLSKAYIFSYSTTADHHDGPNPTMSRSL